MFLHYLGDIYKHMYRGMFMLSEVVVIHWLLNFFDQVRSIGALYMLYRLWLFKVY